MCDDVCTSAVARAFGKRQEAAITVIVVYEWIIVNGIGGLRFLR